MIGGCPFGLPAFFILAIILNTFSFPTELYHMGKKSRLCGPASMCVVVILCFRVRSVLVGIVVTLFAKPYEDKDDIYDRDQEKQ